MYKKIIICISTLSFANMQSMQQIATNKLYVSLASGEPKASEIKQLIKQGANVNASTSVGKSALHIAAESRVADKAVYKELLKNGANPLTLDAQERTPYQVIMKYSIPRTEESIRSYTIPQGRQDTYYREQQRQKYVKKLKNLEEIAKLLAQAEKGAAEKASSSK